MPAPKTPSTDNTTGGLASAFGEIRLTPHQNNRTAWLMSFIDLTGILVGFFVLVYSTQVLDRASWQSMAGSFHAAFSPNPRAIIPVTPEGQNNALEVVAARQDTLPYLDSLLRQRLQSDPLWARIVGREASSGSEKVMLYALPPQLLDVEDSDTRAAWKRLADVVRVWKNPVAVRVTIPPSGMENLAREADIAVSLARILGEAGVMTVSAEVVSANIGAIELVVRAQQ